MRTEGAEQRSRQHLTPDTEHDRPDSARLRDGRLPRLRHVRVGDAGEGYIDQESIIAPGVAVCDGLAQRRVRDRVEGGDQEDPPRVRGQHEDGGHRGRPPGLAPHLGQAELDGARLQGRHVSDVDGVPNLGWRQLVSMLIY